jgi:hypothetical protein
MPGPEIVPFAVAAVGTTNIPGINTAGALPANCDFNPGALPQPTVDNVGIKNGQYFLLTDQTDPNQNGLWFADANGPVAIQTFGLGNVNPNATYQCGPGNPGSQNGNTLWGYTAQFRNTGNTPGFQLI